MSHGQRLWKLEGRLTVTLADRGSYCAACGGVTIEEALLAADRGETDWAEGDDRCRRCGGWTLAGGLRKGLAEDEG